MKKIIMMVMAMIMTVTMVMGLSIDASAMDIDDEEITMEYIGCYMAEKNNKLADKYGFTYIGIEYYRTNGIRLEVLYYKDVKSVEGLVAIGNDKNYDVEIEKGESNTYVLARRGIRWWNNTEIEVFIIDESLNNDLWRINPQAKNDDKFDLIEAIRGLFLALFYFCKKFTLYNETNSL